MLLTFKSHIKHKGRKVKTGFKSAIQNGDKVHTIRPRPRPDQTRGVWKPGRTIHFWENSPRNPSNYPVPFFIDPESKIGKSIPCWVQSMEEFPIANNIDHTAEGWIGLIEVFRPLVAAIEEIDIYFPELPQGLKIEQVVQEYPSFEWLPNVVIGGKEWLDPDQMDVLIQKDGLKCLTEFVVHFFNEAKRRGNQSLYKGIIIHWTLDHLYNEETAQIYPEAKEAQTIPI